MKTTKTPRASLCCKRTARQILTVAFMLMAAPIAGSIRASADGIQDSVFYLGTVNLLKDLMTVAMILAPVTGGLFAVYYLIRRGMADEQDGKMWTRRIWTAIICGVSAGLVTGIISLIAGYYVNP